MGAVVVEMGAGVAVGKEAGMAVGIGAGVAVGKGAGMAVGIGVLVGGVVEGVPAMKRGRVTVLRRWRGGEGEARRGQGGRENREAEVVVVGRWKDREVEGVVVGRWKNREAEGVVVGRWKNREAEGVVVRVAEKGWVWYAGGGGTSRLPLPWPES